MITYLLKIDKKTLIFDLDETLVHCNASENVPSDVVLPIKLNDGNIVRVIFTYSLQ